jgi:DNA-binding response OmpR family regulator
MSAKNKPSTALIVEDSPTQTMHLERLLTQNGLDVICAHDGEDGLHQAQLHLPAIIILDIELPGMDGLQLCRLLKENKHTRPIPIILFTHLADMETAKFGFQAGAIKYIPKDEHADHTLLDTLRSTGLIGNLERA